MLRERVAPWVIWISAVVGTVLLWQGVDNGHLVTGFAETITVAVAPTETGRVSKVLAAQGAEVQRGQAVAVLDAGPIAHEIRALKAERARLEAELTKTRLEAQRDLLQVDRAAGEVAARSKRTLRDADAILAERRAALTAVDRELRALNALVDQRLLDRQAISRLTIERATLRKAVAEGRASAALAQTQASALSDAPGGGDAWVEAAGAPILKAMDAIDTQLLVAGT
ncbi:MAG: multidrug resistance efflux pump, partial [Myxococcota bacterium]